MLPATFVHADGIQATIARMLREYEALGGPRFAVTRDGIRFHVVPVEVLNAGGEPTRQGSILDTVINVPAAERDGAQLLEEICNQIQKQTGYRLDISAASRGRLPKPSSERRDGPRYARSGGRQLEVTRGPEPAAKVLFLPHRAKRYTHHAHDF
jgi:hypothetical protein